MVQGRRFMRKGWQKDRLASAEKERPEAIHHKVKVIEEVK